MRLLRQAFRGQPDTYNEHQAGSFDCDVRHILVQLVRHVPCKRISVSIEGPLGGPRQRSRLTQNGEYNEAGQKAGRRVHRAGDERVPVDIVVELIVTACGNSKIIIRCKSDQIGHDQNGSRSQLLYARSTPKPGPRLKKTYDSEAQGEQGKRVTARFAAQISGK